MNTHADTHQCGYSWLRCCFLCQTFHNLHVIKMGPVRITSWYPKFNGSHFGMSPVSIHRMTGLAKFVWNMMDLRRPHSMSVRSISYKATTGRKTKRSKIYFACTPFKFGRLFSLFPPSILASWSAHSVLSSISYCRVFTRPPSLPSSRIVCHLSLSPSLSLSLSLSLFLPNNDYDDHDNEDHHSTSNTCSNGYRWTGWARTSLVSWWGGLTRTVSWRWWLCRSCGRFWNCNGSKHQHKLSHPILGHILF